jgi:pilus assembly protein CpaC
MAINLLPRSGLFISAFLVVTFLVWIYPVDCRAAEIQVIPSDVIPDLSEPQKLELVSGKSVILKSPKKLTRVSEPDPQVATALLLSANELYLTPKGAGTTNLILWQDKEVAAIYELKVVYDLSRLKQRVHEIFPDETELRILSTHDSITLSGRVSSTSNLDQILTLAESFAPRDKIRNMVQVGGVHQVMLEVKVADVSKDSLNRLGVNFNLINRAERFSIGFLGSLLDPTGSSGAFSLWRTGENRNVVWEGIFDILKEQGSAKILAEPSLIALSGQTASFLAGGEFPIPTRDAEGAIGGVEFKAYGIELAFTPTVLSNDRIAINVTPVVSELDPGRGTDILGSFVPGLVVRRAETTVELGDGQSFAIAGLLSESSREVVSKFPGLGDLPILGALFTSKSFQSNETELVILVTPRLVKPIVDIEQPLPTDFYIEPDDTEFYLYGLFGPAVDRVHRQERANFDGEFGHVIVR